MFVLGLNITLGVVLIGSVLRRRISAIARDLIKVLSICARPNNVNYFMERHVWMLKQVIIGQISQDFVVRNFFKFDCR